MAVCKRCTHEIETGDKYAVDHLRDKLGREYGDWYHWLCIKKDLGLAKRVVRGRAPYVRYNVPKPGREAVASPNTPTRGARR